ncbi:MAG: hypothetical protein ABSA45_06155 [Verrucomicrobiota bacterium]|jgi:hypothetical protein
MSARAKKIILLLLAAALLAGSGQLQKSLNRDRDQLGLTQASVLENAPPLLAFTTVALGGFRGLISNYLWIRSNELQLDDKFFEAAQLADWITDLEPHFEQVWIFEAWNMAFNISVKFKDFSDRWRWLEQGIELLRDRALRYNPDGVLIYQQLAWLFQFKMGQNMDEANLYYKQEWAREMAPFFGPNGTNFADLIHPQTAGERTNALALRETYKVDPVFAQKVDAEWGPLDWRLPEAHAIYWAALGLEKAEADPDKVKTSDLNTLRRVIYQSMQQAFRHGRYIANPFGGGYALGPNLDLIPKVNDAYEKQYAEEPDGGRREGIQVARRNFLGDAVYYLYDHNRVAEAAKWYRYLGGQFPNDTLIHGDTNSFARNLTLDEYAVARVQADLGDTSQENTTSDIQGLLTRAYIALAIGQDDRCYGYKLLAQRIYDRYRVKTTTPTGNERRVQLPPLAELDRTALNQLLDPQQGLPYVMRAVLRTQLGMPAETNAPPAAALSTNVPAPASPAPTSAPATNSVGR